MDSHLPLDQELQLAGLARDGLDQLPLRNSCGAAQAASVQWDDPCLPARKGLEAVPLRPALHSPSDQKLSHECQSWWNGQRGAEIKEAGSERFRRTAQSGGAALGTAPTL